MASCLHELHQCVLVKPPTLLNCFLQLWQFCVRKCLVLWPFQICSLKGDSVREKELWTTLRTLEWLFPYCTRRICPAGQLTHLELLANIWLFLIRIKWIASLWNGFLPSWTSPMCSCIPPTLVNCFLQLSQFCVLKCLVLCFFQICSFNGESVREIELWTT